MVSQKWMTLIYLVYGVFGVGSLGNWGRRKLGGLDWCAKQISKLITCSVVPFRRVLKRFPN